MGRDGQVAHAHLERAVGRTGGERSSLSLSREEEQRLRRRMCAWAYRRLGISGDDFDDMYQAAWDVVVLESSRKGPPRSLEAALRWGLEHRWIDELRRRARRPTTSLDEVSEAQLTAPADTQPSERVERLEAARHLLEAVEDLTARQWRILLLADLWELRPAKVQAALGISARTYRRDHAAALASIATRMGELLNGAWCRRHANLMAAYATGSTTGKDSRAAQRHLTNCLTCKRAVIEHRRARVTYKGRDLAPHRPDWPLFVPATT